jgi:hypothetical protein
MALISSLPSRPLTDDELYALHTSGKFVSVVPINAVTDPDKDRQRSLVVGAIFVTQSTIVSLEYIPNKRSWSKVYQDKNGPESEKNAEGVVDPIFNEAETALEEAAFDMEASGDVSEIVERQVDPDGEAAIRDAAEFGELLQQHYDDAT